MAPEHGWLFQAEMDARHLEAGVGEAGCASSKGSGRLLPGPSSFPWLQGSLAVAASPVSTPTSPDLALCLWDCVPFSHQHLPLDLGTGLWVS